MSEQSMRQIVERCQQGDREAFGQLYTAMSDRLRKVCRRYVTDEDTVNDLLHDSFILIFSKINTLKDLSKPEAWMQKVTKNLTLNYLQHQKLNPEVSLDDLSDPLAVAAPTAMPITYDEIMNLIDALPNSYQRVFRLSVLDGLSHQEIAALLNIEPHTSSAQLFRAKKLLRQSLTVLLLSLLCISLPLGWLWMNKMSDIPEIPDNPDNPPLESTAKPHETSVEPHEPSVMLQEASIRPYRKHSRSVQSALSVLPVSTESEPVSLPDSVTLTEEKPMIAEDYGTPEQSSPIPEQSSPTRSLSPTTQHNNWSILLAYSGLNNNQSFNLPYGEYGMNDPEMDTITHHRMPLTIALSVDKMLNRHLSIGTGLQYTHMYSETQVGNTYSWEQKEQHLRYLGIPLRLSWHPIKTNRWHVYGTIQMMMELPLHSTLKQDSYIDGMMIKSEELRLSPSLQWSIGAAAGLEYRLTPVIGIYAEPSLQYFFKTGDGIDSYRTKHPATFSVPLGIRITIGE